MPRFTISDTENVNDYDNEGSPRPEGRSETRRRRTSDAADVSLGTTRYQTNLNSSTNAAPTRPQSVSKSRQSLTTLSPDGRSIHLLHGNQIETHVLPLHGTTETEKEPLPNDLENTHSSHASSSRFPPVILTPLPSSIVSQEVVELVCVEGDAMPKSIRRPRSNHQPNIHDDYIFNRVEQNNTVETHLLPLLCIYTRHAVYLLRIGYTPSIDTSKTNGEIIEMTQPFGHYLLDHIIRVRPAPHRRLGYATLCPPGAMVCFCRTTPTTSIGGTEYSLLVHHGIGSPSNHDDSATDATSATSIVSSTPITEPLRFQTEAILDEHYFCDFSFAQSNDQSLLCTLSVHLLKSNGTVFAASPILVHGAMVPKALHTKACNLLLNYLSDDPTRQCQAGEFFLRQAFSPLLQHTTNAADSKAEFMVARLYGGDAQRSTLWPLQLQGPLVHAYGNDEYPSTTTTNHNSLVLEPFFCRNLVGFVVAGCSHSGISLCVTPSTAILPRFTGENVEEQKLLDTTPMLGLVVEQIPNIVCHGLVRDPVINTMMHCIMSHASGGGGVMTLDSHAMREFSASMTKSTSTSTTVKPTKAWMAVELPAPIQVDGAVVSGDAHLGHCMVAYLSTGQLTAINLTETKVRYEATTMAAAAAANAMTSNQQHRQPQGQPNDEALQTMEATPAFHEQLGPIVEKIEAGLLGMTRIVGTSTHVKDLDPGLLATALSVRQRCEDDLVVHLKYLQRLNRLRLVDLHKVLKGQIAQVNAIQESLQLVSKKTKQQRITMQELEDASKILSARSSNILQSAKDLRPLLTRADKAFIETIHRTELQCTEWEQDVQMWNSKAHRVLDSTTEKTLTALMVNPTRNRHSHYNRSHTSSSVLELEPLEKYHVDQLLQSQGRLISQSQEQVATTNAMVLELLDQAGIVPPDE